VVAFLAVVVAFLAVVVVVADSAEHSCCEREQKVSKSSAQFRDSEAGSWGARVLLRCHPYHFHHDSLWLERNVPNVATLSHYP
jgi:hypothetical protein